MMISSLNDKFKQMFSKEPLLVRAPGRINFIGEHTDYNEGFVLPAAINKQIVFAIQVNHLQVHRLVADDLDETLEVPIHDIYPSQKEWANYLLGIIAQLNKKGVQTPGVDCLFGGDIPMGAGLSSSAAMETGFVFALNELFSLGLGRLEMVQFSQMAEHEYAGVQCGIMDQFVSLYGEKNKVFCLDCRSLEHTVFDLELGAHEIVLCDSGVTHSLASSAYNSRRRECEQGIALLKRYDAGIASLRDVPRAFLLDHKEELEPTVFNRCKFVVEENQRVQEACHALETGNLKHFGNLMYQTHAGLRDEYEVSCRELDILVDVARECGVTGSRMMGGGFGGCTINIVQTEDTDGFIQTVVKHYKQKTGMDLATYTVSIEKGADIITDV